MRFKLDINVFNDEDKICYIDLGNLNIGKPKEEEKPK